MPKVVKKAAQVERAVIYPELKSEIYAGDSPLTVEIAKDFLGWTEEGEEKFKDEYDCVDENGVKIRFMNNHHNRPFYIDTAKSYAQDILNKKFAPKGPNGEAVIIGRTGLTISAQHRLAAVVLASQMLANSEEGSHWRELWGDTEPYIETFVSLGIDESNETTATLDNVRSRTLSDSLYASGQWENKGISSVRREKLTKTLENAIRFLWDRTGMKDDAYSPYRTNSEQIDFIKRHKDITRAVKHIFDEENPKQDKDDVVVRKKAISRFLPTGRSAGLCYLMMASASDPEVYRKPEDGVRSQDLLDMSNMDKAIEFWTLLAGGSGKFILVHKEIEAKQKALAETGSLATVPLLEKEAIIIKAWHAFLENGQITPASLKLEYEGEGDDRHLVNAPSVGGIDFLGQEALEQGDNDPTPEEIEAAALEARKKRQEDAKAKLRAGQGGGGLQPEGAAANASKTATAEAKKPVAASKPAPTKPAAGPTKAPTKPVAPAAKK